MSHVRNKEFDSLWDKNIDPDVNIINLFNQSIPYSFNFLAKNDADIDKAREIVDHVQHGYPYQEIRVRFRHEDKYLYQYLLMVKETTNFTNPNGLIARKLDYVLSKLNRANCLSYITGQAFQYTIPQLSVLQRKPGDDDKDGELKVIAFKKIYWALRLAQNNHHLLLSNFLDGKETLSASELTIQIRKHAAEDDNNRTAQAWNLALKHYDDCNSHNKELMKEISGFGDNNTRYYGLKLISILQSTEESAAQLRNKILHKIRFELDTDIRLNEQETKFLQSQRYSISQK